MAGKGGIGSLNGRGCPTIEVEIYGAAESLKRPFTAVVDTGFSGFALVPMYSAFPLGLILHNTATITLADGSEHSRFVCLGSVAFGESSQVGTIIIDASADEVLLGMEFLKKFGLTFAYESESGAVVLLPTELLRQAAEKPTSKS